MSALLLLLALLAEGKEPVWRCADARGAALTDATQLTREALIALTGELVPLVEEGAGARFEEPPTVGTTDAEGLADIVQAETRAVLGNLYQAPDWMLDDMAARSRFTVPGILGKYAPGTGQVYLGLQPLARAVQQSLKPEQTLAAACLVLAHELTHALQDQKAGHGERFGKVQDMDAFNGLRAVSEGHAVFVEERVAEKLGLVDVFWALNRHQGWGPDGLEKPEAFALWGLYGQGRRFVRHWHAQGGHEQVWAVLRQPPARTSMIFRPETWSSAGGARVGPAMERLHGVEQKLTKGDWAVVAGPVGEYDLRADVAGLPDKDVDAILEHLVHAHQRDLAMPDREAHIRVLDFDEPGAPYRYLELLARGQEAMAAALSRSGEEWTVTVVPYEAIQGDAVVRRVVAPKAAHPSRLETQSVWVVRGTRLVVVQVQRFRPGLRMDWTLEEVFARLSQPDVPE